MTMPVSSGTNTALGGGGFHHVAVRVPDFDAAVRFYTQAMGFTEKVAWGEGDKRAVMLDVGQGDYLEVFAGGTAPVTTEGAILHLAVRTSDCDSAIERVRAAGVEITVEPKDITLNGRPQPVPARIAFCKGPAGELIEFFQNEMT